MRLGANSISVLPILVFTTSGLFMPNVVLAADEQSDATINSKSPIAQFLEPETPAFQLMGVASSDVLRPQSPKDIAVALLNGFDQNGNIQSGVALEFSPFLLLKGKTLSFDQYYGKNRFWTRALGNLNIALAFSKGGSDADRSAKASAGLVWTPLNGADPNTNLKYTQCVEGALRNNRPETGGGIPDPRAANDAYSFDELDKAIAGCLKNLKPFPDYHTSLQFGIAPVFMSSTGKTNDMKFQELAANGFLTLGLSNKASDAGAWRSFVSLGGVYRLHELIPDPDKKDAKLRRDRFSLGGRYVVGKADRVFINLEAMYQSARYDDRRRDRYATISAGVDFKIASQLWLGANLGGSVGRSIGKDETFIGTRFKWGFGKSSAIQASDFPK